jgi:hypothetical protein
MRQRSKDRADPWKRRDMRRNFPRRFYLQREASEQSPSGERSG